MILRPPVLLRDPETTAQQLLQHHGRDAVLYSAQMLGEAIVEGDERQAKRWRGVINALDTLDRPD